MLKKAPEGREFPDRWTLIRDVAVLQVKLVVDGLRDFILVPTSLVAGVISLVTGTKDRAGPQFYELVRIGKQSEEWIDLFQASEHAPPGVKKEREFAVRNMDELVDRFESFVVDEYKRGGITAQAKERIDRALDALQRNKKP